MKRLRPTYQRKQQTSEELLSELLDFLQRKFYQGHAVEFVKDRPRLLKWVVLWPAVWLDKKGVTLPDDQYRQIFMDVMMNALRFGDTSNIGYLPAWLAKVIQSHFAIHGDEIYEKAKSIRVLAENALMVVGKAIQARPDPVRELALASRLVRSKKAVKKHPQKEQLSLL